MRLRPLFFAFVWLAGRALVAEEAPIALPPFLVEEVAKGPPWLYAEAMGYEILSRCDERSTRRIIEAHHRLHELLAEILPPALQLTLSVPRTLILYDEELQPAASQEVIARLLRAPARPGAGDAGDFVPIAGGRGVQIPLPSRRYSFLPNLRLWDRDAMAVFMIWRRDAFEPDRLSLTYDYIAYLVRQRLPALPPWFVSGFLALYARTEYGGDRLTTAPLVWISAAQTEALRREPASAVPVAPLDEFFQGIVPTPGHNADFPAIEGWRAQAALLVRWGLDAERGAFRPALWQFVERVAKWGNSEELFTDCFGFGYAEAHAKLTAYLPTAVRRSARFAPARFSKLPAFVVRPATDAEIARIKGDWERMEVPYVKTLSAELAPKYLEQARRTLRRPYDRDNRDPRLLAVLGLCEVDAGNEPAAREFLEAADRLGTMRPRAAYELARLRFAEFRGAGDGRLGIEQAAAVLKPLFAARTQSPPLPEVYDLIAEVWAQGIATPTRPHLAVLDEGVRFFPRRTSLVLRAAELNLRHGYREQAGSLLEIGARTAVDEASRERLARLRRQYGLQE